MYMNSLGDKFGKEKGRAIESLRTPDFKWNASTDLIHQCAIEREYSREASQNARPASTPSWLIPGYVGSTTATTTASSSEQTDDILMSDSHQHQKPTLKPTPTHSPTSLKPITSYPLARAYLVPPSHAYQGLFQLEYAFS
ncbi:hypothetical protein M405DRAFT_868931 [Rhizopogon salebrosus TDB-379]|nr:hypothetical protein M405DRAFT_868931 [Rhizopogon salebrosus TDB-379]